MQDFVLSLGAWWPLLLLPLAIWITIRSYAVTRPQPVGMLKRLLPALRLLTFLAVIVLACRLRLGWQEVHQEPARLAVLFDNSASMPFVEARTEVDWYADLARSLPEMELECWAFGDSLYPLKTPQELHFDEGLSNPAAALRQLSEDARVRPLSGVLLVSDGTLSSGNWPVETARRAPFRTWVAVSGRRQPPADLQLRRITANSPARVGLSEPVQVEVGAHGLEGHRVRVELLAAGKRVADREFTLGADGAFQEAVFDWVPDQTGTSVLSARASLLEREPQESSQDNNQRSLHVKVREAARDLLLLADRPSADLGFVTRTLQAQDEFRLHKLLPQEPGGRVSPAEVEAAVSEADLVVMLDWPRRDTPVEEWQALRPLLARKPLFVCAGSDLDLQRLSGLLPVTGSSPLRKSEPGGVKAESVHPVLGEEVLLRDLSAVWEAMPPILFPRPELLPVGDARVLLRRSDTAGTPVLVLGDAAGVRRACLGAENFWRWEIGSQLSLGENTRAQDWLLAQLRWLDAGEELHLLSVQADREVLSVGDEVRFSARLREEDGHPRGGASLNLELIDSSGVIQRLPMLPADAGEYHTAARIARAGAWRWRVSASEGDRRVLADSGLVTVETFSPEQLALTADVNLAAQIAAAGGGSLIDLDRDTARDSLARGLSFADLDRSPRVSTRPHELHLVDQLWLLYALLGLLAVEWLLRRLWGLL